MHQIELHAFPQRYNERFRGLRKSLAGVPVDLSGDSLTPHQVLNSGALVINALSASHIRMLLHSALATQLFVRRYTEDSHGALITLSLGEDTPPRDAIYLACEKLPLVLERHERLSALSAHFDPFVRSTVELLCQFLRHAHAAEYDLLAFSDLEDREYE